MHTLRRILVLILVAGCAANPPAQHCDSCDVVSKAANAVIQNPGNNAALDAYIATLVETPEGSGIYAVEGDLRMTRGQIRAELGRTRPGSRELVSPGELIVNTVDGKYDYWRKPADRHLTYVFDTASFPSQQQLTFTRTHLAAASKDWEDACPTCGVTFTDLSSATTDQQAAATFRVTYSPLSGGVIAQSFFPSDAQPDRILYVYPSFFETTGFDPTGVLRHELGHVLGYRHEQIVGVAGCAREGSDWKMISPYTPNSVMHYFCGGRGSYDLSLRDQDKRGHRCLYLAGKPCPK